MSRSAKPWIPALVTVASIGLVWVWAPAAVGVSFIAWFMTMGLMFAFNVPATRLAFYVSCLAHAATVYLPSGSVTLGLATLCALFIFRPNDVPTARYLSGSKIPLAFPPLFLLAAVVLFAVSWPVGPWRWAATPSIGVLGLMYFGSIIPVTRVAIKDYDAFRAAVKIGEPLEDFTLPLRSGEGAFTLSEQRGNFVLLSFLRGDWCPTCQVLMRMYKKEAPRLKKAGVHLVVVSPSPADGPEAESFAKEMGLDYTVLVDKGSEVAKLLGSMHSYKNKDEPVALPVALLVDPDGVLRFVSKPDDASFYNSGSEFGRILEESGHSLASA